jgi:hypothetical protein
LPPSRRHKCRFAVLERIAERFNQLALRHRDDGQRVPRSRLIVRWLLGRAAEVCGGGRL